MSDNIQINLDQVTNSVRIKENKTSSWIYLITKRMIDIIGAIAGLIILSPIMVFTAICVKLESKGPVVFSQTRVGLDGNKFKMYKFRSMIIDAEKVKSDLIHKNEMSGPMFKMKEDPRITKVGKFIRRTSIDELPQLFNIIKGEMSLVGPRPSLPDEVDKFDSWMKRRLEVKPGLTCFWQVSGRNNIDFKEWMELDIKYVEERNLYLDIKLIFKTVFVLFGDQNAS